jgi:hypothetical protein
MFPFFRIGPAQDQARRKAETAALDKIPNPNRVNHRRSPYPSDRQRPRSGTSPASPGPRVEGAANRQKREHQNNDPAVCDSCDLPRGRISRPVVWIVRRRRRPSRTRIAPARLWTRGGERNGAGFDSAGPGSVGWATTASWYQELLEVVVKMSPSAGTDVSKTQLKSARPVRTGREWLVRMTS